MPGKYGEWRFDKRSYAQLPPPRHLGDPPPGMDNGLVKISLSISTRSCTIFTQQ